MTNKRKPKVGETLYRLNVGNNARHCPQVLTPVKVSKVGRKYFTVKKDGPYAMESEHRLDTWGERSDYSGNYALYESQQAWEDEKETRGICRRASEAFTHGRNVANLSIDELRAIAKILDSSAKERP